MQIGLLIPILCSRNLNNNNRYTVYITNHDTQISDLGNNKMNGRGEDKRSKSMKISTTQNNRPLKGLSGAETYLYNLDYFFSFAEF